MMGSRRRASNGAGQTAKGDPAMFFFTGPV